MQLPRKRENQNLCGNGRYEVGMIFYCGKITKKGDILKEIKKNPKKIKIGYKHMIVADIAESAFADDLVMYAWSIRNLQENLNMYLGNSFKTEKHDN